MKHFLTIFLSLIIIFCLSGCGKIKKETLTCHITQDIEPNYPMKTTNTLHFENHKLISMEISATLQIPSDHLNEIDHLTQVVKDLLKEYENLKGVTFSVSNNRKIVMEKINLNISEMDQEGIQKFDIHHLETIDKAIQFEKENGYTCAQSE